MKLRPQFNLKHLLLLVAVSCVLFAGVHLWLDLRREPLKEELKDLEFRRSRLQNERVPYVYPALLEVTNVEIEEKRRQLGLEEQEK